MAKMRNCPFCKKEVNEDAPVYGVHYNKLIDKWLFLHVCSPDIGVVDINIDVYGKTKEEVIDRWNGVQDEVQESESL